MKNIVLLKQPKDQDSLVLEESVLDLEHQPLKIIRDGDALYVPFWSLIVYSILGILLTKDTGLYNGRDHILDLIGQIYFVYLIV